jgi:hypothetical protein
MVRGCWKGVTEKPLRFSSAYASFAGATRGAWAVSLDSRRWEGEWRLPEDTTSSRAATCGRFGEPLTHDGLEGIGVIRSRRTPLSRGVLAGLERGAKFRAPGSRGLEGGRRVGAEPRHRLLSAHLVSQAPEPRVRRRDEEVQAAAVSKLIRLERLESTNMR